MNASPRSGLRANANHARQVSFGGSHIEAAPDLERGQVRCPVCRKATTRTARGYLKQHNDLFGHRCYNKAPT